MFLPAEMNSLRLLSTSPFVVVDMVSSIPANTTKSKGKRNTEDTDIAIIIYTMTRNCVYS